MNDLDVSVEAVIPSRDVPPSVRPGAPVPCTLYVWLFLLLAGFLLPPVLRALIPDKAASADSAPEAALTSSQFEKYVSAETNTRVGLNVSAADSGSAFLGARLAKRLEDSRRKSLREAVQNYVALSDSTHVPNMARRALILHHVLGDPLDDSLLQYKLRPSLRVALTPNDELNAEIALWQALYGNGRIAAIAVPKSDERIRRMHLGFLQDRALADLYHAAGDPLHAQQAETRLDDAATRFTSREASVGLLFPLAGLIGIVVLIVFARAAAQKRWYRVARVGTAPLRLGWGDLLDGFVFYLALYKTLGLLLGANLLLTGATLTPAQAVVVNVAAQVSVGILAILYVWHKARQRGTTLADIGLTTRGDLWGNVWYGVLGYCAAVPLVLAMGTLAHLIFRDSTSTTPNPVMPLMIAAREPGARVLIFLMASVGAPLFEEFFFRGVLFSGLRTRYGWVMAAAVSTLCFAVVHPLQDWLPILTLGFVFATMREMRQSIVPGIVAHFLQNTMSFVFMSTLFR